MSKKIKIGPGVYITSAFIGPGTVTMCLLAGVNTGVTLLWAVLFSTLATIILQDMCVRLGFYTKHGLEDTVRTSNIPKPIKLLSSIYILLAILIGNCAYQSGNMAGTKLGLQLLKLPVSETALLTIVTLFCIVCIIKGNYELIKKVLSLLVFLMCITFIFLALLHLPSITEVAKGSFIPYLDSKDLMLAIGLIGTTVVPYNLFLHSNLIAESAEDISSLRKDSVYSILLGGTITASIILIGNTAFGSEINSIKDMSLVLEHTYGPYSRYFLALGLFAAGLSSSLTAPLAAAMVTNGIFNQSKSISTLTSKIIQVGIVLVGFIVVLTNVNNIAVIKVAQVINGILLPIFAIYLLVVLNDRSLLKVHKNSLKHNIFGVFVVIVTLLLAAKSIFNIF